MPHSSENDITRAQIGKHQRIKYSLISGCAAALLCLCGPVQAEDIKIGFLGGFTGPIESLTPPIFAAAELAKDHINAQGGILGGNNLVLVSGDTGCSDAATAANSADRLVNTELVTAIVGALCSGATISAANNAAIPAGVVMLSPASTSPALTELNDNDLVYRTTPSDAYQGAVLARLLRHKGIENIVITYVNNDYGKGFAEALAEAYAEQGGDVAATESHEEGRADYRAELGSLAATGKRNLVVLAYASGSGQTLLRQAIESGDFDRFIGGDGMVGDELLASIGADQLAGMIATKPGATEQSGSEKYKALANAGEMEPTAVFGPQSYDATFLLALAIEQAGSNDRSKIAEALVRVAKAPGEIIFPGEWAKAVAAIKDGRDINYEGASGPIEFDDKGDIPGVVVEVTVEDGKFVELGAAR